MAEDWDLYAVVRSYTSYSTSTDTSSPVTENRAAINPLDCLAALTFDDEEIPFSFPNLEQPRNSGLQELQDSYKPFLPGTSGQGNILSSSASGSGVLSGQNQPQVVPQHQYPINQLQPFNDIPISSRMINYSRQHVESHQNQRAQLHPLGTNSSTSNASSRPMQSQSPRSRKKKSNQKRLIVHVTAENLANDVWAWRKYGQKPIKGSPYPRNYYRCSSSKGCSARKQVEKSNTDPNMYIVSYTGDHTHPRPTHRNSLAGSTRNKHQAIEKSPDKESETSVSGDRAISLYPRTPLSTATIDNQAAAAAANDHNHNIRTEAPNADIAGADNMEGHAILESDCDDFDDDDDNDGDALIHNMALSEDIIKELQELC